MRDELQVIKFNNSMNVELQNIFFFEFPSKFEFQTFKKYSIQRFSIFILIIVRKTYGGLFINLRFQTPKKNSLYHFTKC